MSTASTISERKLAANRANASKSAGPPTLEGNRQSSRNSIKHGLFAATEPLMEGDQLQAFNLHRIGMLSSLNPLNFIQLRTCELIIQASWTIHRISQAEQASFLWEAEKRKEEYLKKCARKRVEQDEEDLDWDDESEESAEREREALAQDQAAYDPPASGYYLLDLLTQEPGQGLCRFERLQRYRVQQERSMHRHLAELRRLKKEARDDSDLPSELTQQLIDRWEAQAGIREEQTEDEPDHEADHEAESTPEPMTETAPESAPQIAPEIVSPGDESEIAKTNPPMMNPPATPGDFQSLIDADLRQSDETFIELESLRTPNRFRTD